MKVFSQNSLFYFITLTNRLAKIKLKKITTSRFLKSSLISFFYFDAAEPSGLFFQDSGNDITQELIFFHDTVMISVLMILIVVGWLMFTAIINKFYHKFLVDGILIEIIWTCIPAVILIFIAFPSLQLLYVMDEVINPSLTIKAIGHQWYWSYEYSTFSDVDVSFDSYMIPTTDLEVGDMRLLEVDNRLILPVNSLTRVIVTGADVIHCFAIPSLGVKVDAIPGRLNQTSFFIKRASTYYGQCSEICGSEHSFMPIVVEAVSESKWSKWINNIIEDTLD